MFKDSTDVAGVSSQAVVHAVRGVSSQAVVLAVRLFSSAAVVTPHLSYAPCFIIF